MKRRPLSDAPEALEPEQRARIRTWASQSFPFLSNQRLRDEWERCRDWHRANGVLRADHEAAFRNWLRKAAEFSGHAPRRVRAEPEAMGQVLELFRK